MHRDKYKLSLYLSTMLYYGTVKVFNRQIEHLLVPRPIVPDIHNEESDRESPLSKTKTRKFHFQIGTIIIFQKNVFSKDYSILAIPWCYSKVS
ncbi:hypothetical protein SK128_007433 [Halocaridina rubra]|uniref:Uncharacterized protein n=1 Tax=Halocaridina rubra TaxID=373956 RepID=A0AAN9A016_HALRR